MYVLLTMMRALVPVLGQLAPLALPLVEVVQRSVVVTQLKLPVPVSWCWQVLPWKGVLLTRSENCWSVIGCTVPCMNTPWNELPLSPLWE